MDGFGKRRHGKGCVAKKGDEVDREKWKIFSRCGEPE